MPGALTSVIKGTPKAGFTVLGVIKKYWYWIILFAILLPSIITSIQTAVQTHNPSYPLFDLATRILAADSSLDTIVDLAREDISQVIGMAKPESGIWKTTVYYWHYFFRFWYRIIGDVWLIFFPLVIFFKIIHAWGNRSEPRRNFAKASRLFLLYLFVTNTIILMYRFFMKKITVEIPPGTSEFYAYWLLFLKILPFHGLLNLLIYIVQKAII